jgi:5'-nucleotidase
MRLRIFHINDTHSHIDGTSIVLGLSPSKGELVAVPCGGYSLIHAFVQAERAKARAQGVMSLFVHAGDCFEGSLYFTLFHGRADVTLLNRMSLEAMAVGNHEFDRGDRLLASFARRARFPILCSNLAFRDEVAERSPLYRANKPLIHCDETEGAKYVVRTYGKDRIALFGLTLPSMADIAAPSEALEFLDPYSVAREVVRHATSVGINKIVLLSHLGIEQDRSLATTVPGISLIIGGHSHVLQGDFSALGLGTNSEYAEVAGSTLIVQAGQNAMGVGMCDLNFDQSGRPALLGGGNTILFNFRERRRLKALSVPPEYGSGDLYGHLKRHTGTAFVKENASFSRLLGKRFARPVSKLRNTVVGFCPHDLSYNRIGRSGDPNSVCTLVAKAMLDRSSSIDVRGDFAIINAGAVRGGIRRGPVTLGDIHGRLLPFPITLVAVRVSGDDIIKTITGALENALLKPDGTGSFPYAAGLSYEYVEENGKVSVGNVAVYNKRTGLPELIQPASNYVALVTSYMARGKEGYGPLRSGDQTVTQALIADILVNHLKTGILPLEAVR